MWIRMEKVIATGSQDFEYLRKNNGFYVDKTDFIRKWWKGLDSVTLITRPRRFGKTLNMSTLNCFFSAAPLWQNAEHVHAQLLFLTKICEQGRTL